MPESMDGHSCSRSVKASLSLLILAAAVATGAWSSSVSAQAGATQAGTVAGDPSRAEMIPQGEPAADLGEESGDPLEGFDDDLGGFDDDDDMFVDESAGSTPEPSRLSVDGHVKSSASLNLAADTPGISEPDWRGLSRLSTELQLELEAKPFPSWQARASGKGRYDLAYAIKGRETFTPDVLDSYEKELEVGEAFILGRVGDRFDLKVGRQIVVWGRSDSVRVSDVLNPLDLREPGITDIEDLRLPVGMTRLDCYLGRWNLTAIALHEIRFNKLPVYGSDFYSGSRPLPPDETPSHGGENTEFAAAANGTFRGWDLSLYWARLYDDLPHAELGPGAFPPELRMKHARLTMLAAAASVALGNWLLKAEAAHFDGLGAFAIPGEELSRVDAAAGIEYAGLGDSMLSIEIMMSHHLDFDPVLEETPDSMTEGRFQSVLRASKSFLNETLTVTLLASTFGPTGEHGAMQRLSAEYDWTDSLKVLAGMALYQSGDWRETRGIGDNDRLFFEAKYSF